ncbi:hypothetical protein RvY_16557 [Ramazzottius varieornatus]|uniref:BK channel n=1 Tax=Ramazzottius varieornatus TaxID=947166 RepID=A0A1D1W1K8_RAMVA|nr:hypothetical protein RvY_16557 [Ramazzottius varieornatus]
MSAYGDYWYGAAPCRLGGEEWMSKRRWFAFLITSVAAPFVLSIPVIIVNLILPRRRTFTSDSRVSLNQRTVIPTLRTRSWKVQISYWASDIISDLTLVGKFLKVVAVLCAVGSLIIYFRETSPQCLDVELCHEWTTDPWWQVDLAFNCYFLVYFFLRFAATDKKLHFIWSEMSLVDYFTIPPTFVAIGLDRNWFGLRFLRVLNLLWSVDLLRSFGVVPQLLAVKFARLFIYIVSAIIIGAGTFLLLECSGDPWDMDGTLQQNVTFWNYAYFSVVTISTVGYGDISMRTTLGKIFCCLYIFACLFFIASFIATASSLLPPPRRHPKFDRHSYFNHIVICGDVCALTIRTFVMGFREAMEARGLSNIPIILLHPTAPDDEMVILLNQYPELLEYKTGSPLDEDALDRACVAVAGGCIILAKHDYLNGTAEDTKSILQVISIKNFAPRAPVQVQVLGSAAHIFLSNYPDMKEERGDLVLCQKDLEYAFLGINCVVPAFSTLLSNLLVPPPRQLIPQPHVPDLYRIGSQMRLCSMRFSSSFHGLTFSQAARLCYEKLNLLLIAVYTKEKGEEYVEFQNVMPNPGDHEMISEGMMAHVVAPSIDRAHAVRVYCRQCHGDIDASAGTFNACQCSDGKGLSMYGRKANPSTALALQEKLDNGVGGIVNHGFRDGFKRDKMLAAILAETTHQSPVFSDERIQLDSTGMFYVCPPKDMESCLLSVKDAKLRNMNNHVVILVAENGYGDFDTEMANELDKIIYPLRSVSNVGGPQSIPPVLIVANRNRLEQIWPKVAILPKVVLIEGNVWLRAVIRAAQVHRCRSCVILSTGTCDQAAEDLGQRVDQIIVMMVLQLRTMRFRPPVSLSNETAPDPAGKWYTNGNDIPIVALFDHADSMKYLSRGATQKDDYHYSRPYMSGNVVLSSQLHSKMQIPACFDPSVLRLLSCLTFGDGSQEEIMSVMAEGEGLHLSSVDQTDKVHPEPTSETSRKWTQAFRLIDVQEGPLQGFSGATYGSMFLSLLQEYHSLALGLYRLFDSTCTSSDELNGRTSTTSGQRHGGRARSERGPGRYFKLQKKIRTGALRSSTFHWIEPDSELPDPVFFLQ